jgi:oligosaccharide repeat unit polymerase
MKKKHPVYALSPGWLMAIIWGICLALYPVGFNELPSVRVSIWIFLMVSFFALGCSLENFSVVSAPSEFRHLNAARLLCFSLVPFQIYYLYLCSCQIIAYGGLASYMVAVRVAALGGEPLIDGYSFFLQINMTVFLISLYSIGGLLISNGSAASRRQFYVFYFLTMASSIIDASRSFFIVSVFSILAMNLTVGTLSIRRLTFISLGLLATFSATFSLFRLEARDSDAIDILRYLFVYLCGSIGSLDAALSNGAIVFWQVLESLSNKLNFLGFPVPTYDLKSLKADYTDLPFGFSTNVYSAFGIYYKYLGLTGSFIFVLTSGFGSGFLYRRRLCSPIYLTCFSLIWPAIVLSPFHDFFLQQAYSILKLLLYSVLFNCFLFS